MLDYYPVVNARTPQCSSLMNPVIGWPSSSAANRTFSSCSFSPSAFVANPATQSASAATGIRRGLGLEFSDPSARRSRLVSLSDLVLDALSPSVYSTATSTTDVTKPVGASSGTVMTPTPTQFLFPQSVTAEQEAYANGFVQALEEMYRKRGQPYDQPKPEVTSFRSVGNDNGVCGTNTTGMWLPSQTSTLHYIPQSSVAVPAAPAAAFGLAGRTGSSQFATNSLGPGHVPASVVPVNTVPVSMNNVPVSNSAFSSCSVVDTNVHSVPVCGNPSFNQLTSFRPSCAVVNNGISSSACLAARGLGIDTGAQDIPVMVSSGFDDLSCSSASSSSSYLDTNSSDERVASTSQQLPINMVEQDHLRLQRKRAKNRVAAARCQMRKVERISKLEEKAQDLRNYNANLSQTALSLRQHVSNLQKQILSHTELGCRLLVPAIQ